MEFSRSEHWEMFSSRSLLQEIFNPGIKPRSPVLKADSLSAEPPGKPKNTGVGSLSLLQQIFPTQESNWILYQLSYEGSPVWTVTTLYTNILRLLKKEQL